MIYSEDFNLEETDILRDKCGIIGVYKSVIAVRDNFLGLHALQPRGQEAVGIVSERDEVF